MAGRVTRSVKSPVMRPVLIAGRFPSSSLVSDSTTGSECHGCSVSGVAAGRYRVTTDDTFANLISVTASINHKGYYMVCSGVTTSAGQLVVDLMPVGHAGGSGADISGAEVDFVVVANKSRWDV